MLVWIEGASNLVTVGILANGGEEPSLIATAEPFTGGNDRADVSTVDLARSLAELEDQPVNILLVAGGASNEVRGIVLGHLEATENEGRERPRPYHHCPKPLAKPF